MASVNMRMATPEGLEPPTYWFEANRSIQLSYGVSIWILLRQAVSNLTGKLPNRACVVANVRSMPDDSALVVENIDFWKRCLQGKLLWIQSCNSTGRGSR